MARKLTAPGPLDTLEQAFDLLQRAPASVWLRYLAGAAPLIVGLMFVWNKFSSPQGTNRNPVIASLLLVMLLVWFYRCRQSFASQLRWLLGLAIAKEKAARPHWSLACFEGMKLVAVSLAILSIVPAAFVTGFFRSLTVYAGEGWPPREAIVKAWKTAGAWQRENWFMLAILSLFGLAVFVNVALTVLIAPMLVKMFTGYESVFTQRGPATLMIELPMIIGLAWICFDPLLQAAYVVRAFKFDGLRTGEDLQIGRAHV